jgi:hypothetical protein
VVEQVDESPRNFFIYVNDDGDLVAVRYDNWKMVFLVPHTACCRRRR